MGASKVDISLPYMYGNSKSWDLHQLSQYCLAFVKTLPSGSDNFLEHVNFLRGRNDPSLMDTVLASELWIAFFYIFSDAVLSYRDGRGYPACRTVLNSPIVDATRFLAANVDWNE